MSRNGKLYWAKCREMGSSTIFREIKDLTDRLPRLTTGGHVAKWEVLVGDISRNGMFQWATCREMGCSSGRHVAKWEVLVGDMSRNGMFYWAFGQTILNLSRLRSGSLEKNMRACRNTGRCFHCGEVGFGWEGCVLNTFRFVDPWARVHCSIGVGSMYDSAQHAHASCITILLHNTFHMSERVEWV